MARFEEVLAKPVQRMAFAAGVAFLSLACTPRRPMSIEKALAVSRKMKQMFPNWNKKIIALFCCLFLFLVGYTAGVVSERLALFPLKRGYLTDLLDYLGKEALPNTAGRRLRNAQMGWPTEEDFAHINVPSLFTIKNRQGAIERRIALIEFIWGREDIDRNSKSVRTDSPAHLKFGRRLAEITRSEVEALRYNYEHITGYDGETYFISRQKHSDCLVIYHDGHHDGVVGAVDDGGIETINQSLTVGCDVLYAPMPVLGAVHDAISGNTKFGKIKMRNSHTNLGLFSDSRFNAMSMMLDHVRGGLNFVVARNEYSTIAMAGLSGGGWTTTVYAALDDRIGLSMAVAGSLPMAFRSVDPRNWGDWEQHEPGLMSIADYSDLYLLGSAADREAYLVFNEFDRCCFGGSGISILRAPLRKAAANLNGTTDLFINSEKQGHILPETARDFFISRLLERRKR